MTTAASPNRLYRNLGGSFEDWTERSGVGSPKLSAGAAFGDVDADGDLDLVVATYLAESWPAPTGCTWKGVQFDKDSPTCILEFATQVANPV